MTRGIGIACVLALAAVAACAETDDAAAQLRAKRIEEGVRRVITELVTDPGALYDRSSPSLQRDRERGSFIGHANDLAQVMGAFEGDVRVLSVDVARGARGRTARVKARLGFERDNLVGQVSFEETDDGWRPLGIELPIPASRVDAWADAGAARGVGPAPEAAVESAVALLEALSERGDAAAKGASEEAAAEAARAVESFGPFAGVIKVSWSRLHGSGDRARMSAILEYEEAWARAEMTVVKAEGGPRPWKLEELRIIDPNRIGEADEPQQASD